MWVGLDLPPGVGELKQGSDPHFAAIVWVRGETFKAETETGDLWQPKWNENQTVLTAAIHTPDTDAGPLEAAAAGSWSLGIVGQSQGNPMAAVDCGEMDPGDVREETVVGNARGGKPGSHEARWYCGVTQRGWSPHHSLSLPTCQLPQLNKRQAGPSNAWCPYLQSRTPPRVPLQVPDTLSYRVGPQPGWPLYVLEHQTTEKDPRQESTLSAWTGRATEKDWPKRPSDHQLQEARKKDSDRAITPTAEAVHVPAHLVPPGSPQAKQLHHLHAQLSLGQICHRQKKFVSMCAGLLWSCLTFCDPVDCGLPSFSVRRGFSRQEYWSALANTGCHTLLEHCISCCPSRWVSGAARTPATQTCTTCTPGPHRGTPKSSRAASEAKPSGGPTCRGGDKTTIETQGQCG